VQEVAQVEVVGESVGRLDEDLRQLPGGQSGHERFRAAAEDLAGVVTGDMMLPGYARMNT
jgi:hypothetical protein